VIEAEAPRKLPILPLTDGVIDPRVILGWVPRPRTIWPPAQPSRRRGRSRT
jgi:hypothetical protein